MGSNPISAFGLLCNSYNFTFYKFVYTTSLLGENLFGFSPFFIKGNLYIYYISIKNMKEKNTFEVVKIENNLFANIKPTIKTQERRSQIVDNKWKKKIRKRDNYRCQCCGKRISKKLEVHHIMPFAKYEDLAKNSGNVISLCHKCHQKYHDIYREKENSVTFAQYLRDYGRIVN